MSAAGVRPGDPPEGRPGSAGPPRADDEVADLSDDIAALVRQHPQLEDLAAGLGDLDTAPVPDQHDRLAKADDILRAILDAGPPGSAAR